MTAYLNIYRCPKSPLDDAGLRAGEHIYSKLEDAAEEAFGDGDYEYTVAILDIWLADRHSGRLTPTAKIIDLTPRLRELEAEARADAQHEAGLRAGAGRVVL